MGLFRTGLSAADEVQPYEELKALQKKAKKPCDRHPNGDCDCKENMGGT